MVLLLFVCVLVVCVLLLCGSVFALNDTLRLILVGVYLMDIKTLCALPEILFVWVCLLFYTFHYLYMFYPNSIKENNIYRTGSTGVGHNRYHSTGHPESMPGQQEDQQNCNRWVHLEISLKLGAHSSHW